MATKRKKKPTCVKGQPCGYSCIPLYNKDGTKRGCRQPVPEDVAEVNLSAVPAKGKKKAKLKAVSKKVELYDIIKQLDPNKPTLESIMGVDPQQLKISKKDLARWVISDDSEPNVKRLADELSKTIKDPETAYALAHGLKAWVGNAYRYLSERTYKKDAEIRRPLTDDDVGVLTAATAALKALPPVTMKQVKAHQDSEGWDGKTVKRWVSIPDDKLNGFLSGYEPDKDVTEKGMFGTSTRDAEGMRMFSGPANVEFVVTPKLDGSGRGKFLEDYKVDPINPNGKGEGEILYEPGTKFKVLKIENGRPPLEQTFDKGDAQTNIDSLNESEKELKQYLKDNESTLKEEGFDFDRPYSVPTGDYDDDFQPVTKPATKEEAIAALQDGLEVSTKIPKRLHKIYMTEV